MYACLAVTCHLHFWQNDRDFLRATAVTRGWNGYRNKSQHRKWTLEKKILPPFQQGFEPATFQSRVRCSNHWAIPAPNSWDDTSLNFVPRSIRVATFLWFECFWDCGLLTPEGVMRRSLCYRLEWLFPILYFYVCSFKGFRVWDKGPRPDSVCDKAQTLLWAALVGCRVRASAVEAAKFCLLLHLQYCFWFFLVFSSDSWLYLSSYLRSCHRSLGERQSRYLNLRRTTWYRL